MSSHHIVREKQEPALFILGLNDFDEEHLGQLLEWSPTVIVVQNMYEKIASMGIKVDVVICDCQKNIEIQEGSIFINTTSTIDIICTGFNYLLNNQYPAVNLICNNFNINHFSQFVDDIDIVVFSKTTKHYPIKTGFSKWSVGSLPIRVSGSPFATQGLKKVSHNNFLTLKDGFFSFNFDQDFLFLSEDL